MKYDILERMDYEAIIGLELHAELNTKTKMFCYSANDPDEKHPNFNICPICLGHPGTLPTINVEAVKKVRMVGLALNGDAALFSQFDRKHYFYPDLPKGYQISQYEHPLIRGGYMDVLGRRMRITRIHLEEDTGRLLHDPVDQSSLIDFNRAGIPLMELVTEPDFRSGEEVRYFGEELQRLLRYLHASDADMEKGQMRVEVNISLRKKGAEALGTKVEVKNINSFKFASDAVEYETERQSKLLEAGEKITQETRGWSEHRKETFSQRLKEEAHDYRYFPEPDLPPLKISPEYVEELRSLLPELARAKRVRFSREYGLETHVSEHISRDKEFADYFEMVVSELKQHSKETAHMPTGNLEKRTASFMTGDFMRLLHERQLSAADSGITPENLAELILYLAEEKISNVVAEKVLQEMCGTGEDPSDIIEKQALWQMNIVGDIEDIARSILLSHPKALEDYRKGKESSLQFLVGQMMKESRGKVNPKVAQEALIKIMSLS